MQKQNNQQVFFLRYLSLIPVIAVIAISIAFSIWAVFNYFSPDLLFHPMP
ncbi:hypothetical protein NIES4103_65900 [Nostoc sp. NIES-4103]|nr:hypothetical protein NIES4103_65900 [Nostoc sp. NIES-4103]